MQEVSLARNRFQIGLAAVVMLVVLRMSLGWHFLYEGVWKLKPSFTSEPFLRQARGPFREWYQSLIPDADGRLRLNAAKQQDDSWVAKFSDETWNDYWRTYVEYYRFSDEQKAEAQVVYQRADKQLKNYLAANDEEIKKYLEGLDRLEKSLADPSVRDMPYQHKRTAERRAALSAQAGPWLDKIDEMDEAFKSGLDSVRTEEQERRGRFPGSGTSLEVSDSVIKYGVTAIGVCLLAGFLTRFSCVAGGLFLLSVILAQPAFPGAFPPPHPSAGHAWIVNKEFIEMAALFALATTHVGRWGGLDFFVHYLVVRPILGRRKKNESKS